MAKRTKYHVTIDGESAKFSNLRHAMLFAIAISDRMPAHLIEVIGADGIAGQYQNGRPTPEFKQHHINGVFA